MDYLKVTKDYFKKVFSQYGFPHRKKLRHKFSRGTLAKNTRRVLVKPIPSKL